MEHTILIFTLGFVFAFFVLVLLLKTPRRLRRAVRVLSAIANALEGRPVSSPAPEAAPVDPLAEDVLSALVNIERKPGKVRRGELAECVKMAIAANPGAGFDVVFRAALPLASRPKIVKAA